MAAAPSGAGRIRVTCIHHKCSDQTLTLPTWRATEAFMDEHVREVAHPREWPVTFRVTYVLSGNVTAEYREPVKVLPCCDAKSFDEHLENHYATDTPGGL